MLELTKRLSLELTIKQWTAVGETEETAISYLKYSWAKDNDYGYIGNSCFLCEYAVGLYGRDCADCPLLNKWGVKYCFDIGSPYSSWEVAHKNRDGKTAQAAAKRIVELCKKELEVLDERD